MNLKSLFRELKRRNIYKVGVVYAITAWVIVQVASVAASAFGAPAWVMKMLITVLLLGFPVALVFAWAFEITPDGIQRTAEITTDNSISEQTGKKLNYWIIGLLATTLVVVLAERIWFAGSYATVEPSSPEAEPSLAILPFQDMSQANDQAWYSDGLTEELLNSLARTGKFHVASRTSSFAFKNASLPIPEIADSLNVNHILEGSVRRSGDEMRITAQLIRAENDNHLWSNTYDVSTDSVFAVQRSIANNITAALNIYLNESERREMLNFGTRNVRAYELYLRAKEVNNDVHLLSGGNLWDATELADRALAHDSTFSRAYNLHYDAYAHYLMGSLEKPSGSTLAANEAMTVIRHDLVRARKFAETETEQNYYRLHETILSDDWTAVPDLIDRQLQNPKYLMQNMGFVDVFIILLGDTHEVADMLLEDAKMDPLNTILWVNLFRLYGAIDDTAFYNTYLDSKRRDLGLPDMMRGASMRMHLRMGEFDRARTIAVNHYRESLANTWAQSMVRAARGDTTAARSLIQILDEESIPNIRETEKALAYHIAGDYQTANRIARAIDARPLGPLELAGEIAISGRMLFFDPDFTPNLRELMEQMGVDLESMESFRQRLEGYRQ